MTECMGKDEAKKNCVLRSIFSLNCRNKPIVFNKHTDDSSDKLFLTTFCQLPDFLEKSTFGLLHSAALALLGREFATVTHFD